MSTRPPTRITRVPLAPRRTQERNCVAHIQAAGDVGRVALKFKAKSRCGSTVWYRSESDREVIEPDFASVLGCAAGVGRVGPPARNNSAAGYSLEQTVEASGSDSKLWPQIAKRKTEKASSRCRAYCFRGLSNCFGGASVVSGIARGEPMGTGFSKDPALRRSRRRAPPARRTHRRRTRVRISISKAMPQRFFRFARPSNVQRKPAKRPKSASNVPSSAPCSMASAARWASATRLPPTPAPSSSRPSTPACRSVGSSTLARG